MIGRDDDATLMQRHVEGDPDAFGEIAVRPGVAIRNRQQRLPDPLLERRAADHQRQVELPALAGEVFAELGA